MIRSSRALRGWAYGAPTDLRKGFDSLTALVEREMKLGDRPDLLSAAGGVVAGLRAESAGQPYAGVAAHHGHASYNDQPMLVVAPCTMVPV